MQLYLFTDHPRYTIGMVVVDEAMFDILSSVLVQPIPDTIDPKCSHPINTLVQECMVVRTVTLSATILAATAYGLEVYNRIQAYKAADPAKGAANTLWVDKLKYTANTVPPDGEHELFEFVRVRGAESWRVRPGIEVSEKLDRLQVPANIHYSFLPLMGHLGGGNVDSNTDTIQLYIQRGQ